MRINENTKKVIVIGIPVIILAIIWLNNKKVTPVNQASLNNAAPYLTDGGVPAYQPLNADYKPQDINVNLNTDAANYLTNKYVPLFGYAGFAVA